MTCCRCRAHLDARVQIHLCSTVHVLALSKEHLAGIVSVGARKCRDPPLTFLADCMMIFLSCEASPLLGALVVTSQPFLRYLHPSTPQIHYILKNTHAQAYCPHTHHWALHDASATMPPLRHRYIKAFGCESLAARLIAAAFSKKHMLMAFNTRTKLGLQLNTRCSLEGQADLDFLLRPGEY